MLRQEFSIVLIIGGAIFSIITFLTFLKNISGLLKVNLFLIPLIILLIAFLGIKKINTFVIAYENNSIYWLLSSILYASYNSIALIPILITLRKYIISIKDLYRIVVFTFIILITLSIIVFLLNNMAHSTINNIEVPIIYIANTLGEGWKYVYSFCILIAIYTTAISSGCGFVYNINSSKKELKYYLIICIAAIAFAQFKFTALIRLLYPILGGLGALQFFLLLIA